MTEEKNNNSKPLDEKTAIIEPEIVDTDKTQTKLSPTDEGILMVAKEHPDLNNRQLGLKLKNMGVVKHQNTVYKRLKKNAYLTHSLDEIKKNHGEFMTREIVPEALKVHKRVLRDKNVPDKQKGKWVEMAEKAEFKTESPIVPRTINIQAMQVVQNQLKQVCQDALGIKHKDDSEE